MFRIGTALLVLGLAPVAHGQCDPVKLTSDGGEDSFGLSVSISGNTAIVGAPGDEDLGVRCGSAYVFDLIDGEWTQVARLTASDGAEGDYFGTAVCIDGDTAIVGAWWDDDQGENSGSAYVFQNVRGGWAEVAKLTASDGAAGDAFGCEVSLSGDTAIVGAVWDDDVDVDSGSAYMFQLIDGVWTQVAKLTAFDGADDDRFGGAVSVSGDTAFVGAHGDDDLGAWSGSAYVFERIGGVWTHVTKLTALDGARYDSFGSSVSVSGDTAIVGAYGDDGDSGSAYVFERAGGDWMQTEKLTASDGDRGDIFGCSICLNGDSAVVGADSDDANTGSAYVFERVGGVWIQFVKLTAPDGAWEDYFGQSVSISGDTALVGAAHSNEISGAAYLFDLTCTCPADFNADFQVDTRDIVAFLNAWASGDTRADWDQNGTIDTQDVLAFLNDWVAGC